MPPCGKFSNAFYVAGCNYATRMQMAGAIFTQTLAALIHPNDAVRGGQIRSGCHEAPSSGKPAKRALYETHVASRAATVELLVTFPSI